MKAVDRCRSSGAAGCSASGTMDGKPSISNATVCYRAGLGNVILVGVDCNLKLAAEHVAVLASKCPRDTHLKLSDTQHST